MISADDTLALKGLLSTFEEGDELEIRLGSWSQNVKFKPGMTKKDFPKEKQGIFTPGVDKEIYDKILHKDELYQRGIIKTERTIVWIGQNIRMIKVLDQNNKTVSTVYEVKERKGVVNLPALSMRVMVSSEKRAGQMPKSAQFNKFRIRDRNSRIGLDGQWRYDFTATIEREFDNIKEAGKLLKEVIDTGKCDRYEIEVEFIGGKRILESLTKQIKVLAELVCVRTQKDKIYTEIYNLISGKNFELKSRAPESIDMTRDLINKPITLQLSDLGKLEVNRFSVTEKADGVRHLMYCDVNGNIWLINSLNEVKSFKNKTKMTNWLIDGELVEEIGLFAAFDCLIFDGKDISHENLKKRLNSVEKIIKALKLNTVLLKKFYFDDLFKSAGKILDSKFPYKIDGLIFTPVDAPYKNKTTFKWKWPEMTTTDFLIRQHRTYADSTGRRLVEFHLYVAITRGLFKSFGLRFEEDYGILFPQIDRNTNYMPVLFQPQELPDAYKAIWSQKTVDKYHIEDNTIVELAFNPEADGPRKRWKFVRTREDKTAEYKKYESNYGNAWTTAMSNLQAVLKPVTEEIIRGIVKPPFFVSEGKESNIVPMRKFHNFIKSHMYRQYAYKANWLLEVAAGRFADLNRWIKNDIKNVVAFDIDEEALKEGLERLKMRKEKEKIKVKVYSGLGNATENWDKMFKDIGVGKGQRFDVISAQFAIHFMLESESTFEQFVKNVRKYLKDGGIFMASALDGHSLLKLMQANNLGNGETLDLKKDINGDLTTVISIKKQCFCDNLANAGQEVSVFIESIGSYTKEYLVNFEYVIRMFQQEGFELVELLPFEDMYQEWRKKGNTQAMSDVEKIYSFMGRFLIMQTTQ